MPLARTSRGPAQTHGRGAYAPAHQGRTRPLTRTRGPRGRRPPVDPRAPAGRHVRRAPVARVRALTPTRRRALQGPQHHASPTGVQAGAGQGPPLSAGGGRRGLVADAVTEPHEAHAATQHDPAGSARAFLSEAALPDIRALNGAGAPTLLPAMHRIVNAVQLGLISPEAALYGHWM